MDNARIEELRAVARSMSRNNNLGGPVLFEALQALAASQAQVARLEAEVEKVRFEIKDVRILVDRCDISYQEAFHLAYEAVKEIALAPSTEKKEVQP